MFVDGAQRSQAPKAQSRAGFPGSRRVSARTRPSMIEVSTKAKSAISFASGTRVSDRREPVQVIREALGELLRRRRQFALRRRYETDPEPVDYL